MQINADIDTSCYKNIDRTTLYSIDMEFYSRYREIPSEFNWAVINYGHDELTEKKKLISKVKNQHLCGCCWAISCATAISDAYVVRGLVNWSPNISFTYAMSKYPQNKCSGGNSRILLENIKSGQGVASEFCVDDSWCVFNKNCNTRDSSKHFSVKHQQYLSSLIPSEGCYNGTNKHFLYGVDDVYSITKSNNLSVAHVQEKIKQHIMVRGPVVGGFLIKNNFPSGIFTKVNEGVYFEEELYDADEADNIIGSHSVVIVGWGVTETKVPYWVCRNSWGSHWGQNGYFKIAMFPFNKICQFTKKIKVINNGKIKEIGGVSGFYVNKKPSLHAIKANDYKTTIYENYAYQAGLQPRSINYKSYIYIILVFVCAFKFYSVFYKDDSNKF